MQQQYVGILLNASMYRGIPRRKTGQESITNYEEGAQLYGLTPCFLRLEDIHLTTGRCVAYVRNKYDYVRMNLPIPRVIHNRAIYFTQNAHLKINTLVAQGYILFNSCNRYGKDDVHRLLASSPALSRLLPNTHIATPTTIRSMMKQYNDIILKPCSGSIGQGIMRLHYLHSTWRLTYSISPGTGGWVTKSLTPEQLPPIVLRRISRVPFLIQQRISLAEYQGNPYDLRVTVQRGIQGQWAITGMYAKVALSNLFVSNIAQGGVAYPVESILQDSITTYSPFYLIRNIEQICLQMAWRLSIHLPWLADVGIDIGLTAEGVPYFIECNGRDQRYGFRKANMLSTWKDSYYQPMAYARYLIDKQ
ncbi:YheC/YheD family endospore coat-associated protein [Paenibacillus sp. CMAA1364]